MARSQPVGEWQVHDFPKGAAAMLTGAGVAPTALPHVCVIITCHNYRRFIVDAFRSVAAQTYPSWDCVIVDERFDRRFRYCGREMAGAHGGLPVGASLPPPVEFALGS
jgi:hypothetical protein